MLECTCCNRSFSASVSLKNHLRWQDKDYRQKHTVTEEHKKLKSKMWAINRKARAKAMVASNLCNCGCGRLTDISQITFKPNSYIHGHNRKNQTREPISEATRERLRLSYQASYEVNSGTKHIIN